jgi:putative membrane protein
MNENPYERFQSKDLILRDFLAMDRTILANERTFLGYIRTALTLLVAGATFIKFFDQAFVYVLGWVFIPLGLFTLVFGLGRFMKMKQRISVMQRGELKMDDHIPKSNDV